MSEFRYTFDGGEEKDLRFHCGEYRLAALAAFGREAVERLPIIGLGASPYTGHVLKIWSPSVMPEYGPYFYGIGQNECGSPIVVVLDGHER